MKIKDDTKRKMKVMQAWIDGKPVEMRKRQHLGWVEMYAGDPHWNWALFDFRIKKCAVKNAEGG